MMQTVGLSVIVPMYNRRKYIEECLDSILTQTYRDLEVIVVDDGSTDGSDALVEEKYGRDPRVVLTRQANQGAGMARNRGLELAHGKYVTFVDSDDFLGREGFAYMVALAEKEQADVVYSMNNYIVRDGEYTLQESSSLAPGIREHFALPDALEGRLEFYQQYPILAVWNKLFRRDFLERYAIRCSSLPYREEASFAIPCLFRAGRYVVTPFRYYVYRVSPGSVVRGHKTLDDVEKLIRMIPPLLQGITDVLKGIPAFDQHPAYVRAVKERQLGDLFAMMRAWNWYPIPEESKALVKDVMEEAFAAFDAPQAFLLQYLFYHYNESQWQVESR